MDTENLTGGTGDDQVLHRLRDECYGVVLPGVPVSADDDLFEIGGDSVMLIRLVAMAQLTFGVEVDALSYFQRPTLATLATEVRRQLAPQAVDEHLLDDVLARVESMTDDEVQRLLDGAGP
ncbi:acyl carrier protein [Micromonospora sp. WMMD1082]|uniref:acyl carrier protein n=1 Tax=Micromonospora sp. WMMD1082 TaxID=3016104 RepID=UPI0024180763|nr:acyl carrier protein [Micromonospora sp. WMMD1082]MDG4797014.1 acyl carrier protein [Micromonospora sp. WMMD1082]